MKGKSAYEKAKLYFFLCFYYRFVVILTQRKSKLSFKIERKIERDRERVRGGRKIYIERE